MCEVDRENLAGERVEVLTWVVWGDCSAKEIFEHLGEVRRPAVCLSGAMLLQTDTTARAKALR